MKRMVHVHMLDRDYPGVGRGHHETDVKLAAQVMNWRKVEPGVIQ